MKSTYYRAAAGAIFVGAVIVVGVSIMLTPTSNKETNIKEQAAITKNINDPETLKLIKDLQSQIVSLSDQVKTLSEQQHATEINTQTSLPDETLANTELPEAPPLTGDDKEQLRQNLSLIETRFQSENIDNTWAYDVASKVQYLFAEMASTNKSTLHNVDCRTSVCKLSVGYENVDDLHGVRLSVAEKLGDELPYGAIQPGSNENEVMIYIGKNPDTFAAAPRY